MRYIGQNCQERRIKDCDSGRQNHLQSSPTQQCQEIALIGWLLRTEIEYFSNDSQHQGQHSRWRVIGKHSSSNSSSRNSLISRRTLRASGKSGLLGKAEQECEKRKLIFISLSKKNSLIQKTSKESKLVRTKFVFEKTLRRRWWCSAKNPAKPFSKCGMWNSLNWRSQRSNAHHAFTTYLEEHFFAIVVSYESSTWTRSTELRKPSRSWKHHSMHLRFPQELPNAARIYGRCITSKLETHHEVLQKASEDLRQSGTDGKMMRFTENLSLPMIGRMLGFDARISLYTSVSPTVRRISKENELCTNSIYAVLARTDRHHFCRRDQGTGKWKSNP